MVTIRDRARHPSPIEIYLAVAIAALAIVVTGVTVWLSTG
jgi:hypothetical protein